MGRPRTDDGEGRYYTLKVRLNATEEKYLDDICAKYGYSRAGMVRFLIRDLASTKKNEE